MVFATQDPLNKYIICRVTFHHKIHPWNFATLAHLFHFCSCRVKIPFMVQNAPGGNSIKCVHLSQGGPRASQFIKEFVNLLSGETKEVEKIPSLQKTLFLVHYFPPLKNCLAYQLRFLMCRKFYIIISKSLNATTSFRRLLVCFI